MKNGILFGALALGLAVACGGGGDADGGMMDGGGVLPDGATLPDGAALDGGTPGPFVPVALLLQGFQVGIYAVNLELDQVVEVSHPGADVVRNDADEYVVEVSPDGRHVAYASGAEVWVAPTDVSGGAVKVGDAADVQRVTWTPDGGRVLYWSGPLVSVLPDGTGTVTLSDGAVYFEVSSTSMVMYVTTDASTLESNAFVVAPDGTGEVDLGAGLGSLGVTGVYVTRSIAGNPVAWSPDGGRIAIVGTLPGIASVVHSNIYLVDPDGSSPLQIAGEPATSGVRFEGYGVQWAPDGSRVAYYQKPRLTPTRLHTVLPDGTADVTSDAVGPLGAWSPDSSHVAIVQTGGGALFLAPSDTLVSTSVATLTSASFSPTGAHFAWSPDSASIAYQSKEGGEMELYVARADGTNATKVSMPLMAGDAVQNGFGFTPDSSNLRYLAGDRAHVVPRPSSVAPGPIDTAGVTDYEELLGRIALELSVRGCVPRSAVPSTDGRHSFSVGALGCWITDTAANPWTRSRSRS